MSTSTGRVDDERGDADLRSWADKAAIHEVISAYTSAANRGDWDLLESLFVEDATWVLGPPLDTSLEGARVIRDQLVAQVDSQDFFQQMTHDSVVTLSGSTQATAVTTIHALARREGHNEIASYGIYHDDLVKVDGAWRFARRMLQPIFLDTSPLPGLAPISRAALRAADVRGDRSD